MKKIVVITLLVFAFTLVFGTLVTDAASKPVTIKLYRMGTDLDPTKDRILLELQKRLNIKLEIITAPWDQWQNKLNMMMAAGEKLDIIMADEMVNPYVQWAKDGLLVQLDPLVKDSKKFPYLNSILKAKMYKGTKVDGKSYVIPSVHHGFDWNLIIRKDWLDKLGLAKPTNTDEFYQVMKAFAIQDPDDNGKNDTVGIPFYLISLELFDYISSMFKSGSYFRVDDDGKVYAPQISPSKKEVLEFCNKLYREGVINRDFVSLKSSDEARDKYFHTGKAGIVFTPKPDKSEELLKAVDPKAKLEYLPMFGKPGKPFGSFDGAIMWLVVAIPKTSPNVKKALEVIEYLNSKEGRELLIAGIKGVHYSEMTPDGVYTMIKKGREDDWDAAKQGYDYPMWWASTASVYGYIPVTKYSTFDEAYAHRIIFVPSEQMNSLWNWRDRIKFGSEPTEPNPLRLIAIKEVQDLIPTLLTIQNVYWTKMIIEKDPANIDKLWDDYVKEWKRKGGDKAVQIYQEWWNKNK